MELHGRELGTHWADFGNVEPNPNRTMPWSGRRLAIHSTADQGSVVTPPSHGGNTGSSLVLSTMTTDLNGETLEDAVTELDPENETGD